MAPIRKSTVTISNPARRQAIHEAFQEGLSADQISAKFALAVTTVRNYHVKFKQSTRDESVRHGSAKAAQIDRFLGMLRAGYQRNISIKVYEPFGGPEGDTTLTYKRAGCVVEYHAEAEGHYKQITSANLLATTKRVHVLDIDGYGYEPMWLLDCHVCERLHDTALLFVTFPMPRMARGSSKIFFKAQQHIGAEGVYDLEDVKKWLEHQLAKDCMKIEHQDIQEIDNMWRIGMLVKRYKLGDFITGQVT